MAHVMKWHWILQVFSMSVKFCSAVLAQADWRTAFDASKLAPLNHMNKARFARSRGRAPWEREEKVLLQQEECWCKSFLAWAANRLSRFTRNVEMPWAAPAVSYLWPTKTELSQKVSEGRKFLGRNISVICPSVAASRKFRSPHVLQRKSFLLPISVICTGVVPHHGNNFWSSISWFSDFLIFWFLKRVQRNGPKGGVRAPPRDARATAWAWAWEAQSRGRQGQGIRALQWRCSMQHYLHRKAKASLVPIHQEGSSIQNLTADVSQGIAQPLSYM